jgi:hypothetical protein
MVLYIEPSKVSYPIRRKKIKTNKTITPKPRYIQTRTERGDTYKSKITLPEDHKCSATGFKRGELWDDDFKKLNNKSDQ